MSGTDQQSFEPDHLLAEVIASHFHGARVVEADGAQVVELGEGLPRIQCVVDDMRPDPPYGAFIFLEVKGGRLGETGALVTASGYGPGAQGSVVTAGCNWACAFGPVLLTAVGRPDLIRTQDPEVEQFEARVGARRYRVTVSRLDRSMGVGMEEVEGLRRALGGYSALTRAVLESGTVPAARSDDLVALGCFLGTGRSTTSETKLGMGDWPAAAAVLEALARRHAGGSGMRMLREWAVLEPLEPAPVLTRDSLQHTLNMLRACADNPRSEAGWCGARHHGMRLGAPGGVVPGLPGDMSWFLGTIAASGAGPGYGLAPRPLSDRWWQLADAGCGARWVLKLADGTVWLDSVACDDGFQLVAPGFLAWYEAWLDNAVRQGGPFGRWEYRVDSVYKLLVNAAQEKGVDRLPETVTRVRTHSPEGKPIGPCHACEETYARYGVPPTVFVTAP